MLSPILTILVILLIIGALPVWPHSRNYGYFPSGIGSVLLIILVVFLLRGTV